MLLIYTYFHTDPLSPKLKYKKLFITHQYRCVSAE